MKQEYYEKIKQYLIVNYNQYFIMSKLLDEDTFIFRDSYINIDTAQFWFHPNDLSIDLPINSNTQKYDSYIYFKNLDRLILSMEYSNFDFEYIKNIINDIFNLKKENKND